MRQDLNTFTCYLLDCMRLPTLDACTAFVHAMRPVVVLRPRANYSLIRRRSTRDAC